MRRDTESAQVPAIGNHAWDRSWPMSIVTSEALAARPLPASVSVAMDAGPTAPLEAPLDLLSPTGTLLHSLVIPGSGQLRTGRGLRGLAVLAGAVGATAYGLLATTEVVECAVPPTGGTCPPGEVVGTTVEQRHLGYGLGVAGALTVAGAVDAFLGARRVNAERLRGSHVTAGRRAVRVLPATPSRHARPGDLPLLEVRFR